MSEAAKTNQPSWEFAYQGWSFTYQPGTRFVEARHPAGGCFSLCEITVSPVHHGAHDWGRLVAEAMNRLTDTPATISPKEGREKDHQHPVEKPVDRGAWKPAVLGMVIGAFGYHGAALIAAVFR